MSFRHAAKRGTWGLSATEWVLVDHRGDRPAAAACYLADGGSPRRTIRGTAGPTCHQPLLETVTEVWCRNGSSVSDHRSGTARPASGGDGRDAPGWKLLRGNRNLPDGHNTRIIDVDGDGRDELGEIGFLLNGDGIPRYSLATQGIAHGDRWFIVDIDPARPGLEGYG